MFCGLVTPRLGGCVCIRAAGHVATAVHCVHGSSTGGGRRKALIFLGFVGVRPPVHRRSHRCAHERVCGQVRPCLRTRADGSFIFSVVRVDEWTDQGLARVCGVHPSSRPCPHVCTVGELSMSRPASLREQMPDTADWVDQKRVLWGREHVDMCIRRAMRGEVGWFYAMEGGAVLGTPWTADEGAPLLGLAGSARTVAALQCTEVLMGVSFAAFMREPQEVTDGTY